MGSIIDIKEPLVYDDGRLIVCIAPREPHAGRDLFRSERKNLLYLMRRYEVDVIHAHWTYEFAWAALDSGAPVLVTAHDDAPSVLRHQFDWYRLARLLMNTIVLQRTKYLSVVSSYLYSRLSRSARKKAVIIPDFFNAEIAKRYKAADNKSHYILSISNGFGKRKNISTALDAYTLVRRKFPHVEYHLVGDGMEIGGPAHRFALANRIANGVTFCGSLSHNALLTKLSMASVFLHPAKEESFGMAPLEAMVVGTPVVGGSQSGNIPFLLDYGKAGQLCNVNSAEAIAAAVIHLLSNPEHARVMSNNAHAFAENNFSDRVIVDKYLEYYQAIVNAHFADRVQTT